MDYIKVRGARQHNLKNVNLDIPKNKLVVFTGLSGSGKSSLAFDTIYAEGQRRYVESLSSYARQFLGIMNKPDVDSIEGLSPAISIDQKSTSHNPRSTVGTVTEIYDYLRLLFARIGHPHCPNCGREISRQSVDQIVASILRMIESKFSQNTGSKPLRYMLLSPVVRDRKGEFSDLLNNLKAKGFLKARIDGRVMDINTDLMLIKTNKHTIEALVDKISLTKKDFKDRIFSANLKSRLNTSIEQATSLSAGLVIVSEVLDTGFDFPENPQKMQDQLFSERFACPVCNISIPEIEPRSFSFNSPHGACPKCTGIGTLLKIDPGLVFNPNLTINEGGILPYAKTMMHDTWWSRILKTFADENGIQLRIPIRQLSTQAKNLLLMGTGDRVYAVEGENRFGRMTTIYNTFEGLIPNLERRYSETDSEFIRYEIEKFMRKEICPQCSGKRLKADILTITINNKSIAEIADFDVGKTLSWIENIGQDLSEREKIISSAIAKEIAARLRFLLAVGLNYITLSRAANSLSGGEAQRIRLASQVGSGLTGVLYVLDEPSIGLHQRDNYKLISTLKNLRDLGNSVVVVEHDRDIMESADWICDFGPGAGSGGGKVIFYGTPKELKKTVNNQTARYLSNPDLTLLKQVKTEQQKIEPANAHASTGEAMKQWSNGKLSLIGASENNLKNINVSFPLGKFICVTGVSGSGKSTLVVETLYHGLAQHFNPYHREKPGKLTNLIGTENIDKVILVDQSPIGRTPRSNPATYTGLFTFIRDLFSQMSDAKIKGFTPGRFSFNVKGGRCEACEGEGQIKIEMQFMSDVYVTCEVCHGLRYNSETLDVRFKGKNIAEVLNSTVDEALELFINIPQAFQKLETLKDVGLSYIHLGQPAPTLSGGEAQRVKLAAELSKRQTGKTVYILDEPTTGLHFADLVKLLKVLKRLVERGNSVIVIEHNLDVIKNADYIIDLGPEGGDNGGYVIANGIPKEVAANPKSYTGQYLRQILK